MDENLVKTQIQLKKKHYQQMKKISHEREISLAQLMREIVEQYLSLGKAPIRANEEIRSALALAGKFRSAASDTSENHDRYLEDIYRS